MENERNLDRTNSDDLFNRVMSDRSASLESQKKVRPQRQADAERRERIRKLLEESKARIRACDDLIDRDVVTIRVSEDGNISVSKDSRGFRMDDTGYGELLRELTLKKECKDLKFAELRALARLLRIVKNSDSRVKVICDNPELGRAFKTLSSND